MAIGFQPKPKPAPKAPFFHSSCLGQHDLAIRQDPEACCRIIAERLALGRPALGHNAWSYVHSNGGGADFHFNYGPSDSYSVSTNRPELIQQLTLLIVASVDTPEVLDQTPGLPRRVRGQDWDTIRRSWEYVMLGREKDWKNTGYARAQQYTRNQPAPSEAHKRLSGLYEGLFALHATPWMERREDLSQRIENVRQSLDEVKRSIWVAQGQESSLDAQARQLDLFGRAQQAA